MNLFDDDTPKLDDANKWVDDQGSADSQNPVADDMPNDVLERSDEFTDKLPADLEDPLVDPIQELKGKIDA